MKRGNLRRHDPDAEAGDGGRIWSTHFRAFSLRIFPGETRTTGAADEMLVTVLGSCVAACIRDPRTGFGGMNHFMLPQSDTGEWNGASAALRYGNYAMEALINTVLKSGCQRQDLEIKVFGGADLTTGPTRIGTQNVEFVLRYLEFEGLAIAGSDLGGPLGRRIHYFPVSGMVKRLLLKPISGHSILAEEQRYATALRRLPLEGAIELFE